MADDPNMPKSAQRRGGADTLFSAEWFDDNDEFTGTKPDGVREDVKIPSSKAAPKPSPPVQPAPAPSSGPPMALIVGVLAVVFLGGGCLVGAAGAAALFLFGLV